MARKFKYRRPLKHYKHGYEIGITRRLLGRPLYKFVTILIKVIIKMSVLPLIAIYYVFAAAALIGRGR